MFWTARWLDVSMMVQCLVAHTKLTLNGVAPLRPNCLRNWPEARAKAVADKTCTSPKFRACFPLALMALF